MTTGKCALTRPHEYPKGRLSRFWMWSMLGESVTWLHEYFSSVQIFQDSRSLYDSTMYKNPAPPSNQRLRAKPLFSLQRVSPNKHNKILTRNSWCMPVKFAHAAASWSCCMDPWWCMLHGDACWSYDDGACVLTHACMLMHAAWWCMLMMLHRCWCMLHDRKWCMLHACCMHVAAWRENAPAHPPSRIITN